MVITSVGIGDANRLSGGIGEALIATASGLVVAIIAYVFHRFLRGKVQNLAIELEREASELIDALEAPVVANSTVNPVVAAPSPRPAPATRQQP